jgi:hypothetical protein
MKPVGVSVINASKILKDAEIPPVVAALQLQVSEHLAPRWNVDAVLDFVPSGQAPPAGNWQLILDDDTNIKGDSGYHNVSPAGTPYPGTPDGIPYGRAFVNTSMQQNESWTITASHELLEMLVNPYAVFAAYVPIDDRTGAFYNLEICDPVSPDICGYKIDGVDVSDFVFPEWFSPFLAQPDTSRPAKQVDYCYRLNGPAPLIAAGTSITTFGWTVSKFGWQDFAGSGPAAQVAGGATRR